MKIKGLKCSKCGWEGDETNLSIEITKDIHCPGCGGFLKVISFHSPQLEIISGLQTGADQYGLNFAIKNKISHTANTHKDFKDLFGNDIESLKDYYNIKIVTQKTGIPGLKERTLYNVINSDITLIFIDNDITRTRGSQLTKNLCIKHNMKYHVIPISHLDKDINNIPIQPGSTINIAGQRKFNTSLAENKIHQILEQVLYKNKLLL